MEIIYYGDITTPDQLRKITVRTGQVYISIRTGTTDPRTSVGSAARPAGSPEPALGDLIGEADEDALYAAVRAIGGRLSGNGCYVRLTDTTTRDDVLAMVAALWGAPVATADAYGETPTPIATPQPAPRGGARTGAGRPAVGRPTLVRLGDDLTARVDAHRADGESRAATIRRLLSERLGGPALTRSSARSAMLGIGAGLTGDDAVTGSDAHYRAAAVLLDDTTLNLAMRPSVVGVGYTVEQAVEDLAAMLAADATEQDEMARIIWGDLAERAERHLTSIRERQRRQA